MKFPKILLALLAASSALSALAADVDILYLPNGRTMAVPGFRMYIATGYQPSERNIEFLKELKGKVTTPRLLAFDLSKNNKNMLLCRGSFPVYGPNSRSPRPRTRNTCRCS